MRFDTIINDLETLRAKHEELPPDDRDLLKDAINRMDDILDELASESEAISDLIS